MTGANAEAWRGRLLPETINRLHTSNAPDAFRKAGGVCASLRAFAFLLAAIDTPARITERARALEIASRFAAPVTDAIRDAVAEFERLLAADDIARQPSPLDALCSCRIIEDVEAELEAAWQVRAKQLAAGD